MGHCMLCGLVLGRRAITSSSVSGRSTPGTSFFLGPCIQAVAAVAAAEAGFQLTLQANAAAAALHIILTSLGAGGASGTVSFARSFRSCETIGTARCLCLGAGL